MKQRSSEIPGLQSSLQEEVSLGKLLHFAINSYLWFTQHINPHTPDPGGCSLAQVWDGTVDVGRFMGCRLWCWCCSQLSQLQKVTQSLQTGITARLSSVGRIKAGLSPHLHNIKMKSPAQAMFSFPPPQRAGEVMKYTKTDHRLVLCSDLSDLNSLFCDILCDGSKINGIYTNACINMVNKRNTISTQVTFQGRISVPILTDKRSWKD